MITKLSHLFVAMLILSGCAQTSYRSYDGASDETRGDRVVKFKVTKAFFRAAPDCVLVLPTDGVAKAQDKLRIERAAARHLRGKIERVIGPDERSRLTRRMALDLTNDADRRYFSKYSYKGRACRFFAIPSIFGIEQNYAFIWAGRRIHLGLKIISGESSDVLWKADHSTDRGDGGLPISLLSLGSATVRASKLNADKDILPSMIDDVFRRILVTLPDTRSY